MNTNDYDSKKYLFYPQYDNIRYDENEAINVVWSWIFDASRSSNDKTFQYELRALRKMNNPIFHEAANIISTILIHRNNKNADLVET